MEDLGNRCEAVRRTRGIRDDVVFRCVIFIVVDTQHNRNVLTLRGGGDDHFFRTAGSNVFLGIFPIREETGGFDNNVHTEFTPRQVTGVPVRREHVSLFRLPPGRRLWQ